MNDIYAVELFLDFTLLEHIICSSRMFNFCPNNKCKCVHKGEPSRGVKPHVHFTDDTSLNNAGTIHDKGHGRPNPPRYVWDWLHRNGWCQN